MPHYDRSKLRPRILHLGVGGFHRAHLALYVHELAGTGSDWGIRGLGVLDADRPMEVVLRSQDHLYTLVERGDGEPRPQVVDDAPWQLEAKYIALGLVNVICAPSPERIILGGGVMKQPT